MKESIYSRFMRPFQTLKQLAEIPPWMKGPKGTFNFVKYETDKLGNKIPVYKQVHEAPVIGKTGVVNCTKECARRRRQIEKGMLRI